MYATITNEKQTAFEAQATPKQKDQIPMICGYYGRACRRMGDKADRLLCVRCPLADFCKD